MKFSPFFLCAFLALSSLPAQAELPRFPEIPSKDKPLSLSLQTEFYRTQANYMDFGQYADLPHENFLQYIAFRPSLSYSPLAQYMNFEIFANSFYAKSKTLNESRNVPFRLSDLGGGISLYHKARSFYAGFELRGGAPLENAFKGPEEMILGDSSYFAEPGGWLFFQPAQSFYIYLNTAFRWRFFLSDPPLSSLAFARLGGLVKTRNIDAGAGIESFASILPDGFSAQPDKRWNLIKKVNGGSYKFHSVNPFALSWIAWMNIKFQPVYAKIYFNLDTLGKNYAKGLSFGLIAKLKWSLKSSVIEKRRGARRFDFSERDFERETEPSQEKSYFKEEEDPYREKNIKKELKQELKSLKY